MRTMTWRNRLQWGDLPFQNGGAGDVGKLFRSNMSDGHTEVKYRGGAHLKIYLPLLITQFGTDKPSKYVIFRLLNIENRLRIVISFTVLVSPSPW